MRKTSVSLTDTIIVSQELCIPCSTILVSASSGAVFRNVTIVNEFADCTYVSSSKPPATTTSVCEIPCLIISLERNRDKSDLFSDRARKLFQFSGRGTWRPSITRLIGRHFPVRRFRVALFTDPGTYQSKVTSMRWYAVIAISSAVSFF